MENLTQREHNQRLSFQKQDTFFDFKESRGGLPSPSSLHAC